MKKIILIILIGMFTLAVYHYFDRNDESVSREQDESRKDIVAPVNGYVADEAAIGIEVGNTAVDFELSTLEGKKVKLSDFRGKRVMLNFWATWCPPCRSEIPDMQKFHEAKDVVILAINLTDTESNQTNAADFADKYRITFPILLDNDATVSDQYQIKPIPTSYMIDSSGVIRYKAFGSMNYEMMIQEFEKLK